MNRTNTLVKYGSFLPLLGFLLLFSVSCKKEAHADTDAPVITGVTTTTERNVVLTSATFDQWIIVKGMHLATTQKVVFNTVEVGADKFFSDDSTVTVRVPAGLPDPAQNPITITTKYGSVTYNFSILQPVPVVNSFNPLSGGEGDIVTISGDWFTGLTGVKFDNVPGTVVSSTKTEIKVKVPAGIVQAFLYVTTPSGTTKSKNAFGFKFIVYDDALAANWWKGGWNGAENTDFSNTVIVKRGTSAGKIPFTGGYGGFQVGNGGSSISLVGFIAVKVSLYGGPGTGGKKVKLVLNGNYNKGYEIVLTEGAWNDLTIGLDQLGNPDTLTEVVIQEFSGNVPCLVYFDDLGLI
ncbi:MAG TPA: IPT/TIG domain-containing protein [Chitinophagaceae bacterium]|nr:IPT/TIG domain-containing protein [Chitinophagaceae bacterium]